MDSGFRLFTIALTGLAISACSVEFTDDASTQRPTWSRTTAHSADDVTGDYRSHGTIDLLGVGIGWDSELILQDDDRFVLEIRIEDLDDGDANIETIEGTYRVRGSWVVLQASGDDDVTHLRIRGDELQIAPGWLGKIAHVTFRVPLLTLQRVS